MATLLYRLGRWSARRRRLVLALWIVALISIGVGSSTAGGTTSDSFSIPGTESQAAFDLLEERFPEQGGSTARVVVAPESGSFGDPANATALDAVAAAAAAAPEVVAPSDPSTAVTISPNGAVAFVEVRYAMDALEVGEDSVTALEAAAVAAGPGLQVEFGGDVVAASSQEEPGGTSELIGLGVAVVVLLFSFGSLLAMGMTLLTALIGLGISLASIALLSAVVDLSSTAPILSTMIGLAVGIDYALFIVTRHRQNLAEGLAPEEAAARANATAGSAVVFAGVTVVIALAGLAVVGIPFLTVMGLAAAAAVAVAVVIAVTLLPALLGFAGHTIDRLRVPGLRTRTGHRSEEDDTWSARWARRVTRHPGRALLGGLVLMGLLAVPAAGMRLGLTDAGTQPESSTQRRAYDLLADGFGPGFNGPLTMVVDLAGVDDTEAALARVGADIGASDGVAAVGPAVVNAAGDTAVVAAIPTTAPADVGTDDLVHSLRDDVVPGIEATTGATVAVTGSTAANIDVSDKLGEALPAFIAVVVGLTIILLMAVFRSILVPIKAAIAILVSIASSFGVLVAVFQWGWLKDLVGLEETVPIVSFLPMMMFAILFGLSMDYEVFIMSRVREDYVRTRDARGSVLSGLTASARVITAAALIMISVFASFILGDDAIIKMFGLGLAVAVLLDATVVRMVLVPATMAILGDRAWWLPRWLDRLLPDVDVEGERLLERLERGELAERRVADDEDDAEESDRPRAPQPA